MLAFGANQTSLLLAAGAGFLSLGTFIFNYFIRGEKLAQNYVREQLEQHLGEQPHPETKLMNTPDGYVCEFRIRDEWLRFTAADASEAYAAALLHMLGGDP